jgi:retron-type reverse transcriptase
MDFDYDELISVKNLFESWRAYKKGKSRKRDVMEFERHLEDNLFALHQKLQKGNYSHDKYAYFRISDPKKRDIYKSTVRDRIVHQALYNYLCKIYEPLFIELSFSSRKRKGTHRAVAALSAETKNFRKNKEKCLAMKCDIRKYFENIQHQILLKILGKVILDKKVLDLLRIVVESFHKETGKGVPLGNITSQVFANIYLHELDKFVAKELGIKSYIRYNDDFIVLGNDKKKLFADIQKIKIFLQEKLALELPEEKTTFRKLGWGIDFCGCIVLPNAVLLRNKTKTRMFVKINSIAQKAALEKISQSDFSVILNSYFGLLSHCRTYNLKSKIKNNYIYGQRLFRLV